MLSERKLENQKPQEKYVSLPHVSIKNDILGKARNLRLKIGNSMNTSKVKWRETPKLSPKQIKGEGAIEMKLKLKYLRNSRSNERHGKDMKMLKISF